MGYRTNYYYNKPRTTLALCSSIDGKIATIPDRNFGDDVVAIDGSFQGINYMKDSEVYRSEWLLTTGKSMTHYNRSRIVKHKTNTKYVVIDNKNLTYDGCVNLAKDAKKLIIVTTNEDHPAYAAAMDMNNIIIYYKRILNFRKVFDFIWNMKCNEIVIQAGGTLNAQLIRQGLIDRIHIFMLPIIVGGSDATTIADGRTLSTMIDIERIKSFTLERCKRVPSNMVELIYVLSK